jgi:hypothetical protein
MGYYVFSENKKEQAQKSQLELRVYVIKKKCFDLTQNLRSCKAAFGTAIASSELAAFSAAPD